MQKLFSPDQSIYKVFNYLRRTLIDNHNDEISKIVLKIRSDVIFKLSCSVPCVFVCFVVTIRATEGTDRCGVQPRHNWSAADEAARTEHAQTLERRISTPTGWWHKKKKGYWAVDLCGTWAINIIRYRKKMKTNYIFSCMKKSCSDKNQIYRLLYLRTHNICKDNAQYGDRNLFTILDCIRKISI